MVGSSRYFDIILSTNHVFLIDSFNILKEQRLREQQEKLLQLQNGQVRLSPEEESPSERIMGLDLSTWEDRTYQPCERSLQILSSHDSAVEEVEEEEREHARSEEEPSHAPNEALVSIPTSTVVVRERSRTLDEPSQKTTRAKRESRRMRELEQAKFSLELLKVRATGGGASSPTEDRRWSVELMPTSTTPLCSPQGTPDSQSSKGSFELLNMDEEPPKAIEEVTDSEEPCSPPPSIGSNVEVVSSPEPVEPHRTGDSDAVSHPGSHGQVGPAAPSATTHPPKIENYLPTFYVPTCEGSTVSSFRPAEEPQRITEAAVSTATASVTKPLKERRESARRPVVVIISMQKEMPQSEELSDFVRPPVEVQDSAALTGESMPQKPDPAPAPLGPVPISTSAPPADQAVIEKLVRLNEEKEERQRNRQQQNEKEMMEQIRQQKEVLERQRLFFAQYERDMFEKQRGEALHRIQQSRQAMPDAEAVATTEKPLRPHSLLIERKAGLAPHARTQSDSSPPRPCPQLPPPPASAPRERRRPVADGWAPKLTLESKDGGATRAREGRKKPTSNQITTVNLTDKPGNIFFSPKDKVIFAK